MFDFIRDRIRPPGIEFPGLASVFRIIGRVFGCIRDDVERTMRAFFPFLSSDEELAAHARALDIPRFSFDAPEEFRARVSRALDYLETRGWRSSVVGVIERLFPGRYKVIEYPLGGFRVAFSRVGASTIGTGGSFHVFIHNMESHEQAFVTEFLSHQLDPDIEIHVNEWVGYPN